jgi:hypothetical protein
MTDGHNPQEVLAIERQRFASHVKKDTAFLHRVLGDDLIYTHSSGVVDSKASFIEAISSGRLDYREASPERLEARLFGDVAVLTGTARVRVQVKDQPLSLHIRFTDVYVRRPAGWQMVAWQATKLPEA